MLKTFIKAPLIGGLLHDLKPATLLQMIKDLGDTKEKSIEYMNIKENTNGEVTIELKTVTSHEIKETYQVKDGEFTQGAEARVALSTIIIILDDLDDEDEESGGPVC